MSQLRCLPVTDCRALAFDVADQRFGAAAEDAAIDSIRVGDTEIVQFAIEG